MARSPHEVLKTDALPGRGTSEGPTGCVLRVSEGPDAGKQTRLVRGTARVGSSSTCELVLTDSSISRTHAAFSIRNDGIQVEDLESTNGTFYLGQRIERAVLRIGSRVTLGRCVLDIVPTQDAEPLPPSQRTSYGAMVGSSILMRRMYATLERLENQEAPVLIMGETGTGKELVARAIHDNSPRADKPLVVVDCGNMQEGLISGALFGHRRGAFTGAIADRSGAFEDAHGGTIFLDEIGELPLDLQPKLLRVLETGEVTRIGDTQTAVVDVRLIAATHRDLRTSSQTGEFREDLYYRLAVISLLTPALRDRPEDIPEILDHLVSLQGKSDVTLPQAAVEFMKGYDWPGNIRELRNVTQRLLVLGTLGIQGANKGAGPESNAEETTDPDFVPDLNFHDAKDQVIRKFESAYLKGLVEHCGGNISRAARDAGIDRKYLRLLLKRHGLYDK